MRMQAKHVKPNGPMQWKLPALHASDHKYTRGHLAVFGGAMPGAAKLAALAAQRAGAGLVTLACATADWPVYAATMLSVIVHPMEGTNAWSSYLRVRAPKAVVLGPGCQPDDALAQALHVVLAQKIPAVLDAGLLTLLAQRPSLVAELRGHPCVLSPHEGEYHKLAVALELPVEGEKAERAQALAMAAGAVVVLKGAQTIIAGPDGRLLVNEIDAPWLATGGTGDVLAGLIGSLLAQGMEPFDAAAAGVWLHAQAALAFGRGMVAEDLLARVPYELAALDG